MPDSGSTDDTVKIAEQLNIEVKTTIQIRNVLLVK